MAMQDAMAGERRSLFSITALRERQQAGDRARLANGRYPVSLHAELGDILPGVIGIEKYLYEPHRDAYNVIFEQLSDVFGTREFVVYNPRDEQAFWGHALHRIELPPERVLLAQGHYAVHLASRPHWKYFWFD